MMYKNHYRKILKCLNLFLAQKSENQILKYTIRSKNFKCMVHYVWLIELLRQKYLRKI